MRPGFRTTIGADPGEVAGVAAAFTGFAEAHHLPAAIRRATLVALDELLHNTIAYGFAERGRGEIAVDVELLADRLIVTLTDDGPPFDPLTLAAPDTALPAEERQVGGLGIHLVRQLMDDVGYQRRGDHNIVTLAKRLTPEPPARRDKGTSMDITTRSAGGATIVAIAGHLDSNTAPRAQQALDAVPVSAGARLLLDFSAVDYISSAGLRVMLGMAKRLGAAGGELRLFGLNASVREVFDVSGFSTILAVSATEADALQRR